MIEVQSEVDLADRKPRILVNMHFIGIEGSIILSALAKDKGWPRTSGFFQRMKNPLKKRYSRNEENQKFTSPVL